MLSHRVPLVVEFRRFGEVHLVPLEVVQRTLHEEAEVLVVLDQPVPQGVLREDEEEGEGEVEERDRKKKGRGKEKRERHRIQV